MKLPKKETDVDMNVEEPIIEKTQTYVVLKETDEVTGKNRVIYADHISKSELGTNMLFIEHHKKDGSPCQTHLNTEEIQKVYIQKSQEVS